MPKRFSLRRALALGALLVLVACGQAIAKGRAALEVGFGRRSLVTQRARVPLGGYGGRGLLPIHGVHDPCYAKAMVIRTEQETVAIVALDLIGVQRPLLDALETRRFPRGSGLRADRVVITATHTHAGYGGLAQRTGAPYLDGLFLVTCGPFRRGFFDEVLGKIHGALVDACRDLRPAKIGIGSAPLAHMAHSRRGQTLTDPEVGVIRVTDLKGAVRGLLVNFTAHPVILGVDNLLLSAGYPGAMARRLEERHPGATVLFTNGAEGDQSVSVPRGEHRDRWAKVEAAGGRLAEHVDRVQAALPTRATLRLATRRMEVDMPKPRDLRGRLRWRLGGVRRGIFQNIILGDVLLMGVPGEPCCRIGLDMKAAAKKRGFRLAFVLGLAQDHLGYFVHAADYGPGHETSHEYEKGLNFYGSGIGGFLVDVHARRLAPTPLLP